MFSCPTRFCAARRRHLTVVAALVFALSSLSFAAAAPPPEGFAELVAKTQPGVVSLAARLPSRMRDGSALGNQIPPEFRGTPFEDFLRRLLTPDDENGNGTGDEPDNDAATGQAIRVGSGFIIDPAGYVVTSAHVVRDAVKIQATLANGRKFDARIIGRDEETDLALLKLDSREPLPFLAWGDSDRAAVGDWVLAVGNPFGLGGTVTAGILSARDRDVQSGRFDDYLQIDAPMNRGNSGGPLLDREGRVIGVNTSIYSVTGGSIGIGFAVPATTARRVVAELRDHGRVDRAWRGVDVQEVTKEIADGLDLPSEGGALVINVAPNGPAEHAGIRVGDAIRAVSGKSVQQLRDLRLLVSAIAPNKSTVLDIWRDGRMIRVNVVTGRSPTAADLVARAEKARRGPAATASTLGLALVPLDRDARRYYGVADDDHGAIVAGVKADSIAEESGFRVGDVIRRVGNVPIDDPREIVDGVQHAVQSGRRAVLFLVGRDDKQLFIAVSLPKA